MIAASFGLVIPIEANATVENYSPFSEGQRSNRIQIEVTEHKWYAPENEPVYLADSGETPAGDSSETTTDAAPSDEAPASQEVDEEIDAAEVDNVEVEFDETEMDALEYDILNSEEFQNPSATDSD